MALVERFPSQAGRGHGADGARTAVTGDEAPLNHHPKGAWFFRAVVAYLALCVMPYLLAPLVPDMRLVWAGVVALDMDAVVHGFATALDYNGTLAHWYVQGWRVLWLRGACFVVTLLTVLVFLVPKGSDWDRDSQQRMGASD